MPKIRLFIKYWLPALAWMALIFSASSDRESGQHSSRLIEPVLHWLFPAISDRAVGTVILAVRKCAHLTEYAVLALLLWRARRKPVRQDPRPWNRALALQTILVVMLYAASDEFHQRFVPTRQASLVDVLIDTGGGIFGLIGLYALHRLRLTGRQSCGDHCSG